MLSAVSGWRKLSNVWQQLVANTPCNSFPSCPARPTSCTRTAQNNRRANEMSRGMDGRQTKGKTAMEESIDTVECVSSSSKVLHYPYVPHPLLLHTLSSASPDRPLQTRLTPSDMGRISRKIQPLNRWLPLLIDILTSLIFASPVPVVAASPLALDPAPIPRSPPSPEILLGGHRVVRSLDRTPTNESESESVRGRKGPLRRLSCRDPGWQYAQARSFP